MLALLTTITSLLLVLAGISSASHVPATIDPNFFPSLTPKDQLEWVDCYSTYKCARLRVNADVSGKNTHDKVELAIVKSPAQSGNKKGTLIFSLGGYSAANTNAVIQMAPDYAPLYPDYDIIGIDRRGTGYTTPTLKCFKDNDARNAWIAAEPPVLGTSKAALTAHRKRAKTFAKQCKDLSGNVAKYMGTYPSAVDVYTVLKALGEKTVHWHGVSSGTHTAQTFAALYPETVGKFVLDAVVRSDVAYTIIDNQPDSIVDAELAIEAFFITCNAAGPACSFKGTSTTVDELKSRFSAVDKKLETSPIPNPGFKPFDWSAFHRFLAIVVQDSEKWFPALADLLLDLEAGTQSSAMQFVSGIVFGNPPPLPPLDATPPFEHVQAGICIDAADVPKSSEAFEKNLAGMIKASPNIGGVLAQTNLYCTEWEVEPVNRFPLQKLKASSSKIAGQILYISNTADPFCPLDSAYYMRQNFFNEKSTIIIDHAAGHTSISTGALSGIQGFFSLGVFDIMFRYFNLDQTPALNSVYFPDLPPFIDRGAGYAGLIPSGFGGVTTPAWPIPGKQ